MSNVPSSKSSRPGSEFRLQADAFLKGGIREGAKVYPRDVFISFAGPDRLTHAKLLEQALRSRGVSVWIDEGVLQEGDSLTENIGWGLDRAACTVFLVTPSFLKRPWPEKELNAALAREIDSGATRVIVVVDGDHQEVFKRYPLLADKLCIDWAVGVDGIADRLAKRFKRQPAEWHIGEHPRDYVGPVWTRITPAPDNADGAEFDITLLWGPYRFSSKITALGSGPFSLVHHKTGKNDLPLYVRVRPASIVTVGQGPPPDPDVEDIDEGWVRLSGTPVVPAD